MRVDPVRRSRVPVALRRMAVQRIVLAAVIATVALTTAFAAALITYGGNAGDAAVRGALRNANGTTIAISGATPAEPADQATAEIRGKLSSALGGAAVTMYAAPQIDLSLPGSTAANGKATMLLAPQDLATHATLLAGSWPRPGGVNGDVPVALGRAAATIMRVGPGSHMTATTDNGAATTLTVTGVFAPDDPS